MLRLQGRLFEAAWSRRVNVWHGGVARPVGAAAEGAPDRALWATAFSEKQGGPARR